MQPVLFHLGGISVYSFGVFIALGFAAGGYVSYRLARRAQLPTNLLLDYFLYAAVAGLIGARLWHLVFRPFEVHTFWQVFSLWGGGLSLQGGLAVAGVTLYLVMRRAHQPVWRWFDVLTVGLVSGLAVGKIGSFLNGDSFGQATNLPWGVKFSDPLAPASVTGASLHPIQLYAAVAFALIALYLWRRDDPRQPAGRTFLRGLFLVSLAQFLLEFLHAPIDSMYLFGTVRVVSLTALLVMIVSGVLLARQGRRVAA